MCCVLNVLYDNQRGRVLVLSLDNLGIQLQYCHLEYLYQPVELEPKIRN